METYAVVMSEHLNQRGNLFGGVMLAWVDEFAWLAATWEHPCCDFVTVSMDESIFKHAVKNGSILRFDIQKARTGRTSITYVVKVYARASGQAEQILVFSTSVTFVRMGKDGKAKPIAEEKIEGEE